MTVVRSRSSLRLHLRQGADTILKVNSLAFPLSSHRGFDRVLFLAMSGATSLTAKFKINGA
jgi:hypothetical protein